MSQRIVNGVRSYEEIKEIIESFGAKKFMIVCAGPVLSLDVGKYLAALDVPSVEFSNFSPNPKYEDICPAVELFRREGCDLVLAIGGGSAIDVAKCIKLYAALDPDVNYLEQTAKHSDIPLIAIPTTAGTGSESTRFAVIYYKGEKQSVKHDCIVPDVAILLPEVLYTLPAYQKKCTVLDALCQAIESYWSVRSSDSSRQVAKQAIEILVCNIERYIFDEKLDREVASAIMMGSCLAGQAINLTTTTAPHAMSYKLTTLYGLPHGHSVGISLPRVWRYMLGHGEKCADSRGYGFVCDTFAEIAEAMGHKDALSAIEWYETLLLKMEIKGPVPKDRESELMLLAGSVNVERLTNNPIVLDNEALYQLYGEILRYED